MDWGHTSQGIIGLMKINKYWNKYYWRGEWERAISKINKRKTELNLTKRSAQLFGYRKQQSWIINCHSGYKIHMATELYHRCSSWNRCRDYRGRWSLLCYLLEEIMRLNKFISPAFTNRLLQFMSVARKHDETSKTKRITPKILKQPTKNFKNSLHYSEEMMKQQHRKLKCT